MKITSEQQEQGAELIKMLAQKAWEDSAFKDQLITNPVTTIEQITDRRFKLPENKRLIVEDQTDQSVIYLNIPAEINLDELELTDEQLELVAGGISPTLYFAGVGVGIAACWAVSHL